MLFNGVKFIRLSNPILITKLTKWRCFSFISHIAPIFKSLNLPGEGLYALGSLLFHDRRLNDLNSKLLSQHWYPYISKFMF